MMSGSKKLAGDARHLRQLMHLLMTTNMMESIVISLLEVPSICDSSVEPELTGSRDAR